MVYYLPSVDEYTRHHRRCIEFGILPEDQRKFSDALRERFRDIRYISKPAPTIDESTDEPVLTMADHLDQLSRGMETMIFVGPDWKPEWRFQSPYPGAYPRWLVANAPWPRVEVFRHPSIQRQIAPESGFPDVAAARRARIGGAANLPRIDAAYVILITAFWRPDLPETRRKAHTVLRVLERMTTRKVTMVYMTPTISWERTESCFRRCSPTALAWAAAAPMRLAAYDRGLGCLPYDCDPAKLGFVEGW